MNYLIDGHNLIGALPGFSLVDLDDEPRLISLLQEFSRLQRARVEVYFDGAPVGSAATRSYGTVRAYFVRQGRTADDTIASRLGKLGRQASTWTVVSSDRQVIAAARSLHARVLTAPQFIALIQDTRQLSAAEAKSKEQPPGDEEIAYWMHRFRARDT